MLRFDTVICWESQNLRDSVIDLPRLIELKVSEDIIAVWSRFVCLYEVLLETNLIRESKKECRRYKERSAVFISPLKTKS